MNTGPISIHRKRMVLDAGAAVIQISGMWKGRRAAAWQNGLRLQGAGLHHDEDKNNV